MKRIRLLPAVIQNERLMDSEAYRKYKVSRFTGTRISETNVMGYYKHWIRFPVILDHKDNQK